jgi:short subunit dehydrogenase-like uncharacterized protein
MADFLIYGANGYTGALIARAAVEQGLRPILAGRNAALAALAGELRLEHRAFGLDDPQAVDQGIRGTPAVLHCAGPFSHTYRPMVDACLRNAIHYLDITGEERVFEAVAGRSEEARAAGVMLLPGAGFDVVPSDCLAAHLKSRLPAATRLALAISSDLRLSRGTARTIVENLGVGGLVRKRGVLTTVPAAWKTRRIDFGAGPVPAVTIPWGDVCTAWYSTNIPDIETYLAAPLRMRLALRATGLFGRLLASSWVQNFLKRRIQAGPPGPTEEERRRSRGVLWGEACDDAGRSVVSRLYGPDGYTWTVRAALAVVGCVLAGRAPAGFQTPATAYGPDFVLSLEGVRREDVGGPPGRESPAGAHLASSSG